MRNGPEEQRHTDEDKEDNKRTNKADQRCAARLRMQHRLRRIFRVVSIVVTMHGASSPETADLIPERHG